MTGGLEIVRGGVVAVDSAQLRAAAVRLTGVHRELVTAADDLAAVARDLPDGLRSGGVPGLPGLGGDIARVFPAAGDAAERAESLARRVAESAATARRLADDLETLATVYDAVELRAERALAAAAGDAVAVARADDALRALARDDWFAARRADDLVNSLRDDAGLSRLLASFGPTWLTGVPDPSAGAVPFLADPGTAMLTAAAVFGTLARPGVPRGSAAGSPGAHARLVAGGPTDPPRSLADLVGRVPTGDGPVRVRVDRFTMPGGERRYAAYVTGTRAIGGAEPWNMASNVQLYRGASSSSMDVVRDALHASGARSGDVVIPVGHSQGAMLAAGVVASGEYVVPAVVTAGSPTEIDPGPTTMSVVLRHTDDPVAALTAGGSQTPIGSRDSIVVQREADPARGWRDASAPAHQLPSYVETAAAVDASADPRVGPVRGLLADLAVAGVESFEYAGEVSCADAGGGRSRRPS